MSEISVRRRTDPTPEENILPMIVEQAPAFPGLRCIRFAEIEGGPIPVCPGDELRCTIDVRGKRCVLVEPITKTQIIRYIGVYEIENYGGTAAMFFERRELTIHP